MATRRIGGMTHYLADRPDAPLLVLGHGAGAGELHPWMVRVGRGLAARGVSVTTFNFPYMAEGRRLPDKGPVLEHAFQEAWRAAVEARATEPAAVFAGGKSMGGRIASQVAAGGGFTPTPHGLVFFGYPLHPPAKPAQRRDRHLPRISVPMLFLHGSKDPFGAPDEMSALVDGLPSATLHLVDGGDHSLARSKRDDPEGHALDAAMDLAAAWIDRRP